MPHGPTIERSYNAAKSYKVIVCLANHTLNLGPLPAISAGSLADHKQQLAKAIDSNGAAFSANLSSERSAMLRNSIPGTLRLIRRQVSIGMPWAPAIARHPACPTEPYWSY